MQHTDAVRNARVVLLEPLVARVAMFWTRVRNVSICVDGGKCDAECALQWIYSGYVTAVPDGFIDSDGTVTECDSWRSQIGSSSATRVVGGRSGPNPRD